MEEWRNVLLKSKRRSKSSIFSKRAYSACKCALHSARMTKIYITLEIIYYPERLKKFLEVIIEKGKGPVLDKLRITQLIESYLQLLIRTCIRKRNDSSMESNKKI